MSKLKKRVLGAIVLGVLAPLAVSATIFVQCEEFQAGTCTYTGCCILYSNGTMDCWAGPCQ